jgi:hypothetical protein
MGLEPLAVITPGGSLVVPPGYLSVLSGGTGSFSHFAHLGRLIAHQLLLGIGGRHYPIEPE